MAEFYSWFVLLHLIGLVVFAAGHGVNMLAAFRVRTQRDARAVINTDALARLELQLPTPARTGKTEAEPPVLSMVNVTKQP